MTLARWYAVTTQPRHEKAVAQQLTAKSIETFLPTLTLSSQWKDRKVLIERPLFPSYVFTRIDLKDRHHVFSVPSVLRMLAFNGTPAAIDEAEIAAVRLSLSSDQKSEPHPYLKSGELVRVKFGSLRGLEGIVTRNKSQCRIIVSISLLQQSIATEIDADLLEPIGAPSFNYPQEVSFQRSS